MTCHYCLVASRAKAPLWPYQNRLQSVLRDGLESVLGDGLESVLRDGLESVIGGGLEDVIGGGLVVYQRWIWIEGELQYVFIHV